MVTRSPWPFLISLSALSTAIGATMYMHFYRNGLLILLLGLFHIILIMSLWWRDVIREATFEGQHTRRVQKGLQIGIYSLYCF